MTFRALILFAALPLAAQTAPGFTQLRNRKDLTVWRPCESNATFIVQDGGAVRYRNIRVKPLD